MPLYSLAELEIRTKAKLVGDPNYTISGIDTLDEAGPQDASFLSNPRYQDLLKTSRAGVICILPNTPLLNGKNYLISEDPSLAFQQIAELFIPKGQSGFQGIHPTAIIHPSAKIGQNVSIGPYCVIDQNVTIEEGTILSPHVSIGYDVTIGKNCFFHPFSIIRERSRIGNRVILQPGAVIGSCGFGYTPDVQGRYQKLEQLGIVILEDDVEIGANTTIDRSRFKATTIRRGTKIDNLCQIAHNVDVGEYNMIAAQAGIAGSSKTGKRVLLGGQVGIVGHVELHDGVMVSSQSGVSKSLTKSGPYRGTPAIPMNEFNKKEVLLRKIVKEVESKK